ncbi:MAG: thiolase family protein, partial [Pedosphaera sp.]|nr:thiolase family protein [Pedosphaera sp.]
MLYSSIHLVAARRSAIGRFGGGLKSLPAADLAIQIAEAVVPSELKAHVGQVILGQVLQAGSGMNVARQLGLRLGLPQSSPAYTLNMACASGLKAVALAASAVAEGETSLALAGGVDVMSRAPHYAVDMRFGKQPGGAPLLDSIFSDGLTDPVLDIAMGETAERIADSRKISREAQDAWAFRSQSHARANRAALGREIVAVKTPAGVVESDEHPRPDTTLEKLALLKPVFRADGTVTAGNASGINDGAALVLVANTASLAEHRLRSLARIVGATAVGCDPAMMGLGPIGAIRQLCRETGWALSSVDAVEINEAFAVQTIACAQELDLDPAKLNLRGGAIALGHPVGCSGARVLVTLLHLMQDADLKRGIVSLCVGGGMGIAMA